MIVKALALICTLHAVGEHSCPTFVFDKEFSSVKECNTWLIRKRLYNMPYNQKIVLDDCVITKRTDG